MNVSLWGSIDLLSFSSLTFVLLCHSLSYGWSNQGFLFGLGLSLMLLTYRLLSINLAWYLRLFVVFSTFLYLSFFFSISFYLFHCYTDFNHLNYELTRVHFGTSAAFDVDYIAVVAGVNQYVSISFSVRLHKSVSMGKHDRFYSHIV